MRLLVSLVLVALGLVIPIGQIAAHDATPSAQTGTPIAISGAECTVTPRTMAAIAEIVSGDNASAATPIGDPAAYVKPDGAAADPATIAGVTETIQQLVACVNAGDFMRFLALFSNDGLRRYADDLGLPLAEDDVLLTPDPSQNEQVALGPIADVVVLADGRVSALAQIPDQVSTGSGEDNFSVQLILVEQSDRWLIDELIPISPESASSWTPVDGAGYRGVIVSAADVEDFMRAMTGEEGAQGWEPTADDIAQLEAKLPSFLSSAPNAAPDLGTRIASYFRQYAGLIDSDGRQTIFVNAFCDTVTSDWQTEPVLVMDGGDCFFTVTYNVETGTFTGLTINGEA
jgi:hypothetical protein